MNKRLKFFILILLVSPWLFILQEWLLGIIRLKLLIILAILYFVSILSLVFFVALSFNNKYKRKIRSCVRHEQRALYHEERYNNQHFGICGAISYCLFNVQL